LIAGVLGVKLLKVAAAGGLLLLFKKAAWIILLPFFWLWRLIRREKSRSNVTVPSAAGRTYRVEPRLLTSLELDLPDAGASRHP